MRNRRLDEFGAPTCAMMLAALGDAFPLAVDTLPQCLETLELPAR